VSPPAGRTQLVVLLGLPRASMSGSCYTKNAYCCQGLDLRITSPSEKGVVMTALAAPRRGPLRRENPRVVPNLIFASSTTIWMTLSSRPLSFCGRLQERNLDPCPLSRTRRTASASSETCCADLTPEESWMPHAISILPTSCGRRDRRKLSWQRPCSRRPSKWSPDPRNALLGQRFSAHSHLATTTVCAHPSDEDLQRSVQEIRC
jgi:hypothetical protein